MFKLMILPRTLDGLSRTALRRHLEDVHAPLCLGLPSVGGCFTRYVHHYAQETASDPWLGKPLGHWDALTAISFASMDMFRASTASPDYAKLVAPDEDRFREAEGSIAFPVEEYTLLDGERNGPTLFYLRQVAAGADRDAVGREWRARFAALFRQSGLPMGAYLQNIVRAPPPTPFDFNDEIGWTGAAPADFTRQITEAETGLFDPAATRAMITTRRVFV